MEISNANAYEISHHDLCRITAEWRLRVYGWVALWDYQSMYSEEHPDALVVGADGTELYEIKVSRADFLADKHKSARVKWRPKVGLYSSRSFGDKLDLQIRAQHPDLYYIERPHLGAKRYYVCPHGLISPDELPDGWGLFWYDGKRFYHKRKSERWRADVRLERNLVAHALRRYASGDTDHILIKTYETNKAVS